MPGLYDTALPPDQEQAYQQWKSTLPPDLQNEQDYDLRGAYLDNMKAASNGHMGDKFKKPNHMTFSDGSQYSTPTAPGGTWADTGRPNPQQPGQHVWNFWASPENLRNNPMGDMTNYFNQQEKGNNVIFPFNYQLPPGKPGGRFGPT